MDRGEVKQRTKQVIRRTVGEPYVGKRLKLRRLSAKLKSLSLEPRAILDAGAEDATFVYWLADRFRGSRVTACDIDESAIAHCIAARPTRYAGRVAFRVAMFADLEPESFDLITALDVFEHIEDDARAAHDLYNALRPGGTLLVHVPRDYWRSRDGGIERVADEDAWQINPGHVRMGYSPASMTTLLERAGFEVLEVEAWLGTAGTIAFDLYHRVESPKVLRALSMPVTDVAAWIDRRRGTPDGNTVFARAVKRAS